MMAPDEHHADAGGSPPATCPHCRAQIDVAGFAPDDRVSCPVCDRSFAVRAAGGASARIVRCPQCGVALDVGAFAPGSTIECPDCHAVFPMVENSPRVAPTPPVTGLMALLGLGLSAVAVVFYAPLALLSLALSIAGLVEIEQYPRRLKGRSTAWAGIVVSVLILVLYFIFIPHPLPNFFYVELQPPPKLEERAREAELDYVKFRRVFGPLTQEQAVAEERVSYANSLEALLAIDPNLANTPGVTFVFGAANHFGYTFTTLHSRGTRVPGTRFGRKEFVFHD